MGLNGIGKIGYEKKGGGKMRDMRKGELMRMVCRGMGEEGREVGGRCLIFGWVRWLWYIDVKKV